MDESRARRERPLLFASDYQLDILFGSNTIFMDGTFSKSPSHFSQVYIIHTVYHDTCKIAEILFHNDFSLCLGGPCLFALMVNKKAGTYCQMFSELKYLAAERGKMFSPKVFVTDFESGIIAVVKTEVRIYYL